MSARMLPACAKRTAGFCRDAVRLQRGLDQIALNLVEIDAVFEAEGADDESAHRLGVQKRTERADVDVARRHAAADAFQRGHVRHRIEQAHVVRIDVGTVDGVEPFW